MTLTPQQREDFERRGVLKLGALLSAEAVRNARELVYRKLEQIGVTQAGGWRLADGSKPQWPATGLKTSKVIGNRQPQFEALIDEPAVIEVAAALLDGQAWDRTIFKRPQLLLTLPNADAWTLPTGWHSDFPRLASRQSPGIQLFVCLDEVRPRGGATLVVAGSHRLLNDGRFLRTADITAALGRTAFFQRLFAGSAAADLPIGEEDRIELQVMEMTGAPGDAYLMDLRLLHAAAPNASDRPRLMATHRFARADLIRESAKGFGWETMA